MDYNNNVEEPFSMLNKNLGWVYIIKSQNNNDLYKIGFTLSMPYIRAKQLEGTHSPFSYYVEYQALVENPQKVEKELHKVFSGYNINKEWFSSEKTTLYGILNNYFSQKNNNNDITFGSQLYWFFIVRSGKTLTIITEYKFLLENVLKNKDVVYFALISTNYNHNYPQNITYNKNVPLINVKKLNTLINQIRGLGQICLESTSGFPKLENGYNREKIKSQLIESYKKNAIKDYLNKHYFTEKEKWYKDMKDKYLINLKIWSQVLELKNQNFNLRLKINEKKSKFLGFLTSIKLEENVINENIKKISNLEKTLKCISCEKNHIDPEVLDRVIQNPGAMFTISMCNKKVIFNNHYVCQDCYPFCKKKKEYTAPEVPQKFIEDYLFNMRDQIEKHVSSLLEL